MTDLPMPEIKHLSSPSPKESPSPAGSSHFGQSLLPVLLQACDHRLSDVRWFRTDWQRGGALTGFGKWRADDGARHEVVVKMPVPPQELLWLKRLQPRTPDDPHVAPRLMAGDDQLSGYDLAWVIMEGLHHGPLDSSWGGREFPLILDALGRFQARSLAYPVDRPPRTEDWAAILAQARKEIKDQELPESQRWNKALRALKKKLPQLLEEWDARDVRQWCHGDLHLGNAMTRKDEKEALALLFDMAEVRAGHWSEDAIYLEHLFWSQPSRLGKLDIPAEVVLRRKQHGLKLEPNWPHLVNIRRAMLAASAPAALAEKGGRAQAAASLGVLEKSLKNL